jgi:hypothetical protein
MISAEVVRVKIATIRHWNRSFTQYIPTTLPYGEGGERFRLTLWLDYGRDHLGFESGQVRRGCCSPNPTDQLCCPPRLLFNWNTEAFPWRCAWVWALKLTTHLHLVLKLRMSGSIPLLPLYEFLACITTALPHYLQYAARSSIPYPELALVGRFTVFTQNSFNLFTLFKGCLGRIHENGHLSSSDCSCYDFQKNCCRIRYDVQSILWLLRDSDMCKILVTKTCSCDSWGNELQWEVLLSCKLNVAIGLGASWVVSF